MLIYAFYPYLPGGARLTFETVEFQSDAHALIHAEVVLLAHPTCVGVAVYQEDRSVGAYMGPSREHIGPVGNQEGGEGRSA